MVQWANARRVLQLPRKCGDLWRCFQLHLTGLLSALTGSDHDNEHGDRRAVRPRRGGGGGHARLVRLARPLPRLPARAARQRPRAARLRRRLRRLPVPAGHHRAEDYRRALHRRRAAAEAALHALLADAGALQQAEQVRPALEQLRRRRHAGRRAVPRGGRQARHSVRGCGDRDRSRRLHGDAAAPRGHRERTRADARRCQSPGVEVPRGTVLPRRALVRALPARRGDGRRGHRRGGEGAQARLAACSHDTDEVSASCRLCRARCEL